MNNSEKFFALNPMHVLDGGSTIIWLSDAASEKALEGIAALPRDASNRLLKSVMIRKISMQRRAGSDMTSAAVRK